jgi:protein-L-isoaspartate(D-aspartate) O-methyltransferase
MDSPESELAKTRERMVARQIEGRGIVDPALLAAMREVPREAFVGEKYEEYAYDDGPLPILEGQTISQPYVVALMIDSLKLKPSDRVLEIGTGSGYAAAVLSKIVTEVYTVERIKDLVRFARQNLAALGYENVHVLQGDGTLGWPDHAPYNGIVVSAGGPQVPLTLKEQLAVGGHLVIPIGKEQRAQQLVRVTRLSEEKYTESKLGHVRFVPLIGEQGWEKESGRWFGIF